jgi:hypothetical protein
MLLLAAGWSKLAAMLLLPEEVALTGQTACLFFPHIFQPIHVCISNENV